MDTRTIRDAAAMVAAGAGVLLLADLSIGWYSVKVTSAGIVSIEATASGWSNVGLVAGLLTIAMLVYMIRPVRHHAGPIDFVQGAVTAVLGVAVLAFTVAAALTGSASVTVPETAVTAGSRLWPAYAGIVLAAVVAAAALTALVEVMRGVTTPATPIETKP